MGELAGLKKMDMETVKAFVTRQDDKFRHSYGYSVEAHPRQCIIVGSTNNGDGFLRDVTGNRRFWPVTCTANRRLGGGLFGVRTLLFPLLVCFFSITLRLGLDFLFAGCCLG